MVMCDLAASINIGGGNNLLGGWTIHAHIHIGIASELKHASQTE